MSAPRCDLHGHRCPTGSHHPDDDSHFGWDDDDTYTGRDLEQYELDDADAMTGWGRA